MSVGKKQVALGKNKRNVYRQLLIANILRGGVAFMAHLCHFLTAGQLLSAVGQYSGIASASLHALKEMQVIYHQSVGGNELGRKPNFF